MTHSHLDRLRDILWPPERSGPSRDVYALLDGARDPRIYRILRRSYVDYRCLYAGDLPRELAEVAPYLVPLARNSPLTEELLDLGWGNAWGILMETTAPLPDLRRHFRRFLLVRDEANRKLFFRFYDPRVLRIYLPACNAEELRSVFGPVDRLFVEDVDPSSISVYRLQSSGGLIRDCPGKTSSTPGTRTADATVSYATRGSILDRAAPAHSGEGTSLVIRAEQMRALDSAIQARAVSLVREHLLRYHATAVAKFGPDELPPLIEDGIRRARVYRLSELPYVTWFITMLFEVSPRFDLQANIRACLSVTGLSDAEKVRRLLERVSADEWEEAESL